MTLDQVLTQAVSGNVIQSAHIQTIVTSLSSTITLPQVLHGTTAQRLAFGATLSSTSRVQYFDDSMDSAFWWNGSQWV